MVKKRKLSPSASSHSSATPAPPSQSYAAPSLGGISSGPSVGLYSASSPFGGHDGSSVPPADLPGPSRLSASSTPAPLGPALNSDTARAKPGVMVIGSGDGTKDGDECFNLGRIRHEPVGRVVFCKLDGRDADLLVRIQIHILCAIASRVSEQVSAILLPVYTGSTALASCPYLVVGQIVPSSDYQSMA